FRSGDIALGGQGAPFAPVFHKEMFSSLGEKIAILNLGGIANLTILQGGMLGYDVGPANMLLDIWVQKNKNKKFDKGSKWARDGKVDFGLLSRLLDEEFFSKSAPKSTGRELFSEEWLELKLAGSTAKPQDIQRTLLELSISVIAKEVKKYDIELLLACGGGANNEYFIELLAQKLDKIKVGTTDEFGVSGDFMEAMAFAYFAYKRMRNEELHLKNITGASRNGILGAVYAAN
ncbi:MAG: anhydro-N-acetylmuramic acid kinase, partial [Thiovulaceae bacterium]|nr:anhydro-N-acetylmuramic acid kinase [Sulfurimonadaceae bacterium]